VAAAVVEDEDAAASAPFDEDQHLSGEAHLLLPRRALVDDFAPPLADEPERPPRAVLSGRSKKICTRTSSGRQEQPSPAIAPPPRVDLKIYTDYSFVQF
jgi:hypothetical protein